MVEHTAAMGTETVPEMMAGAVAGLSEHLLVFPFDTVKTRMQESHRPFAETLLRMLRTEPWRHFYRGCGPTLASSVPAHAAYFSLYEATKRFLSADTSVGYAMSAVVATMGHDTVSVPFDVVKQHMQIDGIRCHHSSIACLRTIVRDHGPRALIRSLPTTMAMNVPQTAAQWVVYEYMKAALSLGDHESLEPRYLIAGAVAGASAAVVSTPLDVVKTRLQLIRSPNFVRAVSEIYLAHGVSGFARGLGPRVATMAPSAAIVMMTYETAKAFFKPLDVVVKTLLPSDAVAATNTSAAPAPIGSAG